MKTIHYDARSARWWIPALIMLAAAMVAGCGGGNDAAVSESGADDVATHPTTQEELKGFDTPPILETMPSPEYPDAARSMGIEGTVMVAVVVGTDGRVEQTRILESSDPVFDQAAIAAMAELRFKPASWEGVPVRAEVAVPIQFRLD